jgi:CheY-like chemotaxis protein
MAHQLDGRFFVLVVDDNRAAADSLAKYLRLYDYDARAAYDAAQAIAIFAEWPADAALVDVVMEGMDGIELAAVLRQMSSGPLLLVAVTGLGPPDGIAPLVASEFDHVFQKPVDPNELLGLLDARAGRRRDSIPPRRHRRP